MNLRVAITTSGQQNMSLRSSHHPKTKKYTADYKKTKKGLKKTASRLNRSRGKQDLKGDYIVENRLDVVR